MEATQPKTKNPNYVKLTPAELARVTRTRLKNTDIEVEPEWMFIAEFGYYYGWAGVQAILNNDITNPVANTLLLAARKVFYKQNFHQANGTFAATVAAFRAKKPSDAFNEGMRGYRKAAGNA